MKRRALLTLGVGAAAFVLVGNRPAVADLEPDRMWSIYRRYRLLIVGQRDDEMAGAFAGAVVDVLARFLPTSRAQLARAADTRRVGVLIGTDQQDVAIMAAESAEALFLAKPPFDDVRNVPLRLIVSFGSHVLVCRTDFTARHAPEQTRLPAPLPQRGCLAHRGSGLFAGEEMPNIDDWPRFRPYRQVAAGRIAPRYSRTATPAKASTFTKPPGIADIHNDWSCPPSGQSGHRSRIAKRPL